MASLEFEVWTALVVVLTLIGAWYFPALAPALQSLVPAAVPATLGGRTRSQAELRYLCRVLFHTHWDEGRRYVSSVALVQ